jgi:hypothetical protein
MARYKETEIEQGLITPVNLYEQKRFNRSKSYRTAYFIENNQLKKGSEIVSDAYAKLNIL